jgi:EAL domain-containing protein (putative c-di-GMP-specific phosphodiesterase class I)
MLPADYLKIDGSLVEGIIESRIDHAMVAAINEIGHIMGMRTIGEHAHNAAIVSRLGELGVDAAQGFAFGQPRPLDELHLRDCPRQ